MFDDDPQEALERLRKEKDLLIKLNELENQLPPAKYTAQEWNRRKKREQMAKASRRKNRGK